MREFNTSGVNILEEHYTLLRENLIKKGLRLAEKKRYFTIWAPRQTGKSTYFYFLSEKLKQIGYKVAIFSAEDMKNASLSIFLSDFIEQVNKGFDIQIKAVEIADVFHQIAKINDKKCVLIVDEVENVNQQYINDFLHSIRKVYHSRLEHCLKSVILVGVSNIVGIIQDNASPFNIVENLNIPYFTKDEVFELLGQHETETGQLFDEKVKAKIYQITAGQPGLVNGFAWKLVNDYPEEKTLTYEHYLKVEEWYLTEAIDKNFANILKQAQRERRFVERLLFTQDEIPFDIDRPSIKLLHTNGLIKKSEKGTVEFWVPFYKKRLYKAFYPYTNGEQKEISRSVFADEYFDKNGNFKIEKLISSYKEYVKRRSFKVFLEKDENGNYKSIKESALIYSFETFITAVVDQLNGKIYREADTGLGKSDIILNFNGKEFIIETKVYYAPKQFFEGKKQLAYYCQSLGLDTGIYLVFCPRNQRYHKDVKEKTETIDNIKISTYLVEYDEGKW